MSDPNRGRGLLDAAPRSFRVTLAVAVPDAGSLICIGIEATLSRVVAIGRGTAT